MVLTVYDRQHVVLLVYCVFWSSSDERNPTYDSKSEYISCIVLKQFIMLTHWGRVTHICVSKLNIIGSDIGLAPTRLQATGYNTGILLIWPSGTNFSEMLIELHTFSFKKMHVKMSSVKRQPFCLSLNVLSVNNGMVYVGAYMHFSVMFMLGSKRSRWRTWSMVIRSSSCGRGCPFSWNQPPRASSIGWRHCSKSSPLQRGTPSAPMYT